jgi:hypothetical protein
VRGEGGRQTRNLRFQNTRQAILAHSQKNLSLVSLLIERHFEG